MCVGAPRCHRCWFCKLEGSQAPGGYVTRDEAKFGDFVLVSCRGSSIPAHRDPCLQRIFRNIVVALVAKLPQRRPGCLHPSNCNAASGCSLLCACLRAGSGKLFVFNELPWRPPSRPGTVDHAFLCRWQLPSHHFPSAKGFGDVVTHRFLLHSARPRRWALGISSQPPHSLLSARVALQLICFRST